MTTALVQANCNACDEDDTGKPTKEKDATEELLDRTCNFHGNGEGGESIVPSSLSTQALAILTQNKYMRQ